MPKVKIIKLGVGFGGQDVPVGDVIELSEKSAAALIAEGVAESEDGEEETNPDDGKQGDGNEITEEEKQTAALDAQYKRDDLYADAKKVGVDIPFDAKKGEIIAAVIAQGFATALIK